MKERYERCLDLYLCPRSMQQRVTLDRHALLPELPNLAELRPFPTTQSLEFDLQTGRVRTIHVDATGYYLAAGGDGKECGRGEKR